MALIEADSGLNPAQREVLAVLGARPDERPVFRPELRHELRAQVEAGIAPMLAAAQSADLLPLNVNKHVLSSVLGCEAKFLAEEGFAGWSPAIARGKVSHKAIELLLNWRGERVPGDLVDASIARLEDADDGLATWLYSCTDGERAELRSCATDDVAAFLEGWPPLETKYRPVTESRVRVELFDGAVVLRGKVDLTLGHAAGSTAGKVLVDLKTGAFATAHREDLRFYALLEAIKIGVPPRRVASYYLESAELVTEPVDEPMLASAVRRTIEGIRRLVGLRTETDEPVRRPGPACRWCSIEPGCPVALPRTSD